MKWEKSSPIYFELPFFEISGMKQSENELKKHVTNTEKIAKIAWLFYE